MSHELVVGIGRCVRHRRAGSTRASVCVKAFKMDHVYFKGTSGQATARLKSQGASGFRCEWILTRSCSHYILPAVLWSIFDFLCWPPCGPRSLRSWPAIHRVSFRSRSVVQLCLATVNVQNPYVGEKSCWKHRGPQQGASRSQGSVSHDQLGASGPKAHTTSAL